MNGPGAESVWSARRAAADGAIGLAAVAFQECNFARGDISQRALARLHPRVLDALLLGRISKLKVALASFCSYRLWE